jgi:hypothetical protein
MYLITDQHGAPQQPPIADLIEALQQSRAYDSAVQVRRARDGAILAVRAPTLLGGLRKAAERHNAGVRKVALREAELCADWAEVLP